MTLQDFFVGAVAIILGSLALLAAAGNWDWCFRLVKASWLQSILGRGGVRILYALLGLALIALGLVIAMGNGPNRDDGDREVQGGNSLGSRDVLMIQFRPVT